MHRESAREAELSEWLQQMLAEPDQQLPFPRGHMLQESVLIEDIHNPPDVHSDGSPLDKAILQQYARQGIISLLAIPLQARSKTIGVMCLLNDVSGRRYNDYTLRRARELAPRVGLAVDNAMLHAASLQARAEAETAVRTRDQVFRLISHDLRAPLTSIQGYAHLLKRRITAANIPDNERIMRGLANIEDATNRMSAQIQELDDVTSLQRGKPLMLNWSNVDMVVLVRRTVETCQALSEQHRILFETTETELVVVGDDLRMERVLTNLITNAIKYSPEGSSITVTLAHQEHAPEGAAAQTEEAIWAVAAVRDEGIGIPEDEIPLLFQPFHRAQNVSDETPGSGLGLASVRTIVEQHKGYVAVSSQEGAGSTFTIYLPVTR
jgi:signal transduction histidine kinase